VIAAIDREILTGGSRRPECRGLWPLGTWDGHEVYRVPQRDEYVACCGETIFRYSGAEVSEFARRPGALPWCALRAVSMARANLVANFLRVVGLLRYVQSQVKKSMEYVEPTTLAAVTCSTCEDAAEMIEFLLHEAKL
jgi:hypothetical protein